MEREPREDDVRESELVEELGLDKFRMSSVRRQHLASRDWFKHGQGGTVYLTPEGQRKLRIWAEVKDDAEQVAHSFVDAIVLANSSHPSWIRIKIQDGDGEWVAKDCLVPRRIKRYMRKGKKIRVEVVTSINGTGYRHESLADYPPV